MCDPITMSVAATAVSTAGTLYSGLSRAAQQRYSAKIADQNARLASDQARDAIERRQMADRDLQRQNAQTIGAQRAAMAANGVDLDFGSAAQVQGDAAAIGQEDVDRQRRNFANEVRGHDIGAWNYSAQAEADRASAKATQLGAYFDAGSTLLGGAQQYGRMSWNKKYAPGSNPWG